jgi:hypothetical protein
VALDATVLFAGGDAAALPRALFPVSGETPGTTAEPGVRDCVVETGPAAGAEFAPAVGVEAGPAAPVAVSDVLVIPPPEATAVVVSGVLLFATEDFLALPLQPFKAAARANETRTERFIFQNCCQR